MVLTSQFELRLCVPHQGTHTMTATETGVVLDNSSRTLDLMYGKGQIESSERGAHPRMLQERGSPHKESRTVDGAWVRHDKHGGQK